MANSANFALWSPDGTDRIDYIRTVLATMQTSVDTALLGITNTLPAKSVASASARNLLYPSPVQGNRVFRTDLATEELYLEAYNVATNPGYPTATAAGWYAITPNATGKRANMAVEQVFSNVTGWSTFTSGANAANLTQKFYKKSTLTRLQVEIKGEAYLNAGVAQGAQLGLRIGGADYGIGSGYFQTAPSRNVISGQNFITGVAAGAYDIQPVFGQATASDFRFQTGSNSTVSWTISEVI